jgi:hypothetical protein
MTSIADLVPGKCPDLVVTVTALDPPFTTTTGRVGQMATVTDPTGTLTVTLWGDTDTQSPNGKLVKAQVGRLRVGDTLTLVGGWIKTYNGLLEWSSGYSGRLVHTSEAPP